METGAHMQIRLYHEATIAHWRRSFHGSLIYRSLMQQFQPGRVLLGSESGKIHSFDISLLLVALCQIDQTRALGAIHVHQPAHRLGLSFLIHSLSSRSGSAFIG